MSKQKKLQFLRTMLILTVMVLPAAQPVTAQAKEKITCLFIGNSVSYYNNMPEMYGKIVSEATGKDIKVSTLMAVGKSPFDFSFNVRAMVHSKGKYSKLKKSELFYTDRNSFDEKLFNQYKKVLLNKKGKVKHYDYIFLQDHGRAHSYNYSKKGVMDIVKCLADKKTTVVVFMPNYHVTPQKPLDVQKERQDKDDRITKRIVKELKKSDLKFKKVIGAYSGKAFFNYFYAYGFHYASGVSPKDYAVYRRQGRFLSDLVVTDEMHSTQLGAYLHAATLYSAVYKKSAAPTVKAYRAVSTFRVPVFHRRAKGTNFAQQNGPFRKKAILKKACYIADQTQNHGMDFASSKEAKEWKGLR